MPRPDPFTPRRRLLMKIIIWLIFGGTLALAELVVHKQDQGKRVELAAQPVESSGISVRLPSKWKTRSRSQDPAVIAEATEGRGGGRSGRAITVYCDTLASPMSPLEYLARRFDVMSPDDPEASTGEGTVSFLRATRFG